ncbi:urea carboxylase-associated family protein [Kribbella sancticallisti]|uniref:Urea carboxylase-associated family protein n=1 Tax=Kribbella sancticallisti TaxID=460087 RepID=A0ABN2E750_9ACTN
MQITVPARTGRAVHVPAGSFVRVTDLAGEQVGDLFAFTADDHLSASHTRTATSRLFPAIGEAFVTTRRRPILTLVADTSPGHHDLLIAACDATRYAGLGGAADHPSCADNLARALATLPSGPADFGLGFGTDPAPHPTAVPQPVNVFMRVPVGADGRLSWLPAATKPGDAITFRAELDCVVVLSACPQDLTAINGSGPTALALDILEDLR